MARADGPSDVAMEAAIDWMVRLRSGQASTAERQRFEQWRSADAAHASAWQRLEGGLARPAQAMAQLEQHLPGQQAQIRRMLARPGSAARRAVLRSLLIAAPGVGALALAVDRYTPLSHTLADLRTGTGERRSFVLPDGSQLTLNARSAADLAFDADTRQVHLLQGDAIVQVAAHSAPAAPPLCLRTAHALLYPQDRMAVGLAGDCTRVFALQGGVRLEMPAGGSRMLAAGEGAELDAQGLRPGARVAASQADWDSGYLSAAPLPLGEVVAALQRYTPRVLQVSDRAAPMAVHASLPLDDVDRSLRALAESLPLRVRLLGPWVRIDTDAQA